MADDWQAWIYLAAVILPLGAFLAQVLGGKRLGGAGAWLATGAVGAAALLSVVGLIVSLAAWGIGGHAEHGAVAPSSGQSWTMRWPWLAVGQGADGAAQLAVDLGLRIDRLSALMFVLVTGVSTLVHLYSMAYMRGDARYGRFFRYLSLFTFSMLGLVASSNLFLIVVFWELVGICSYVLIGFWYELDANVRAANKAFVLNRVGDVGLLVGLGLVWTQFGTVELAPITSALAAHESRKADPLMRLTSAASGPAVEVTLADEDGKNTTRRISYGLLVIAGLGLFAGCVGKSAQAPLQVWLPDAMAGPTPVSALIHAATMVAAGVYLVGRVYPLFTAEVLVVIAYVGAITLLIGATSALVQNDAKRVLAYSTVSQLGFMMLGLGVGGWAAGLFHLFTHACFKALLFLGTGNVFHATHTYLLPALGGLRRKMPLTSLTMLLATLAIAGVPFFSGFYSKDAILAALFGFVAKTGSHRLLVAIAVIGAGLTACYMARLWFLLFLGTPRSAAAEHAHEAERLMTWPLVGLAVPTVMLGWPLGILPYVGGEPVLERLLAAGHALPDLDLEDYRLTALGASVLITMAGLGLGYVFFHPGDAVRRLNPGRFFAGLSAPARFLESGWGFDRLYRSAILAPVLQAARGLGGLDRRVIDGLVDGLARGVVGLARFDSRFDRVVVDGAVGLVAHLVDVAGAACRALQTGRLSSYLMFMSGAVVAIMLAMWAWIGA